MRFCVSEPGGEDPGLSCGNSPGAKWSGSSGVGKPRLPGTVIPDSAAPPAQFLAVLFQPLLSNLYFIIVQGFCFALWRRKNVLHVLFNCAGFKVMPLRLTVGKRVTQAGARFPHLLADGNSQNLLCICIWIDTSAEEVRFKCMHDKRVARHLIGCGRHFT